MNKEVKKIKLLNKMRKASVKVVSKKLSYLLILSAIFLSQACMNKSKELIKCASVSASPKEYLATNDGGYFAKFHFNATTEFLVPVSDLNRPKETITYLSAHSAEIAVLKDGKWVKPLIMETIAAPNRYQDISRENTLLIGVTYPYLEAKDRAGQIIYKVSIRSKNGCVYTSKPIMLNVNNQSEGHREND